MNAKKENYQLTASIVLYKNDNDIVLKAIESFLNTKLHVRILLIDNSPTDDLKCFSQMDDRIFYLFNGVNIGFGAAHNKAIKEVLGYSKYHLILNPDVYFDGESVLEKMYNYMEEHSEIGILSPKVFYPDGSLQYLCRKLPAPADMLLKRVAPSFIRNLFNKRLNEYEFKTRNYDEIMNVPSLSGCFMFVRNEVFNKIEGFDEKFFMYMEDFDFTRRALKYYKTVYYPYAIIYHHYARESKKNKKLLYISIQSVIYYFNKWGWFVDREREKFNLEAFGNVAK